MSAPIIQIFDGKNSFPSDRIGEDLRLITLSPEPEEAEAAAETEAKSLCRKSSPTLNFSSSTNQSKFKYELKSESHPIHSECNDNHNDYDKDKDSLSESLKLKDLGDLSSLARSLHHQLHIHHHHHSINNDKSINHKRNNIFDSSDYDNNKNPTKHKGNYNDHINGITSNNDDNRNSPNKKVKQTENADLGYEFLFIPKNYLQNNNINNNNNNSPNSNIQDDLEESDVEDVELNFKYAFLFDDQNAERRQHMPYIN